MAAEAQAHATVADRVFTARRRSGTAQLGLFELMTAIAQNDLVDLPAMAAHQRPAVATALAIMMHLLRRYATVDEENPASWAAAWDAHIGKDALRLAAPHHDVAFLQPPTDEPTSQQSVEAADLLLPKVEHEVKQTWCTTAERALFALLGSMLRPNVKDHRSSTRIGLVAILTSDDGTLGDEIGHLSASYDNLFSSAADTRTLKDHFVWLANYTPKSAKLSLGDIPLPFLDVGRAQRLKVVEGELYEIWAAPNNTARIEATDPWLDDPHTPKVSTAKDVRRYKLAAKPFDHRFEHAVLFGSRRKDEEVTRARILDLTEYKMVRLCALGSDQGKTKGYREAIFLAARSGSLFSLDQPAADDRPARLSAAALSTIDAGEGVLRSSLIQLFAETGDASDLDWVRINRIRTIFRTILAPRSIQFVFDTLREDEDLAREQQRLDQLVATAVEQAFDLAATVLVNPLQLARAEQRLRSGIHFELKGASMSENDTTPFLARQTFAILGEMAQHLSPDDRARLRTMSLSDPPLSFWKLVARVPETQTDNERCLAVWKVTLRALGRVYQASTTLGRVLKLTDFPEDRLSRLLAASGSSLPGLLDEVARWLVSHEVERANIAELTTLGLGDALGDHEARDWARRRVALDFVRATAGKPGEREQSRAETVGG